MLQSSPEMRGPRIEPVPHAMPTTDMQAAWLLLSEIEHNMDLATIATQLKRPLRKRTKMARGNDVQNPNARLVMAVKQRAMTSTGLHPVRSLNQPQK